MNYEGCRGSAAPIVKEAVPVLFTHCAQEKLQFYALFKQASIGPNKTPKPSFLNVVAKTKWYGRCTIECKCTHNGVHIHTRLHTHSHTFMQ